MARRSRSAAQGDVFAGLEPGIVDLASLEGEHLDSAVGVGLGLTDLAQLAAHGGEARIGLAVVGEGAGHIGIAVEEAEMGVGVEEREMLGLPVDIDEGGADLFEKRDADGPAVDTGDVAAFAPDFAGERDVVGIVEEVFAFEDGIDRDFFGAFELEYSFDKRGG